MPIYEYSCGGCRDRQERLLPLKEYDQVQICLVCGGELHKLLSAPMVRGDYEGYQCPVTDRWVEGKRQHEENLKRTGCRVYEPGETEQFKQRRRKEDEQFDKVIDTAVERFVETLPPEKKEKLAQEVVAGADLAVNRYSVGE